MDELKVISGGNTSTSITTTGDQFFIRLAKEIKAISSNEQLVACLTRMTDWGKSLEQLEGFVKNRVLELVSKNGQLSGEKGSKVLKVGDYELPIRITRTGTDPRKLELLLRNRGLDVQIAMDMSITYRVNDSKIKECLSNGTLTTDDLTKCEYEKSYSVMPPRKAKPE